MRAWYVVQTKSREEQSAKDHLRQQEYETYLPLTLVDKRVMRGRPRLTEPLFPGYLFVRLSDETDDWRPIQSTRSVVSLVKFGDVPAQMPINIIDALQNQEDEEGVHRIFKTDYTEGDRVNLIKKPFEFVEAIVHAIAIERISLMMNILGRQTKIKVGYQDIEPVIN
ncbi:hypothetical protein KAR91_49295 [Candidatus Pacearchaeota archaeon]|nr:hypothetical protein [Candidatus Pacearchaeota archaeon]